MSFASADPKSDKFKTFPSEIDGSAYSWCPSMDLLAVSAAKSVLVVRMNGKLVWELDTQGGLVKSLSWRPDGRQLAVLTTKEQCLIFDVNSGRMVSNLNDGGASFANWSVIDSSLSSKTTLGGSHIDIMRALPKLPPLPSAHTQNVRFATKQGIDSLIQNEKVEDLDILFMFGENKVNVTLHGLFSIGSVELLGDNPNDEEIVGYISPEIDSQYFLTSSFMTMKHTLRRFRTSFGTNYDLLQDITSSSSKIIALLGYVEEVLTFIAQEVKTYLDFNNRFVNILKDELEKKNETVVDELYNLLLTGMMNDEVKDWIENTIADRGVKRWAKIGETTFDNIRRTMLYHLVPACERLILLLSNLESTSQSSILQKQKVDVKFLDESIQNVKDFLKLVFEFIVKVNKEQELFNSYIIWINFSLVELQEEDTSRFVYKASEVAEFINNYLERSILFMLIPNLRRRYNEIRINTTDLFDSIKSHIKTILSPKDFSVELGRATEKQKLIYWNDSIYSFSHYDNVLEVFKVGSKVDVSNIIITFEHDISDVQITDKNEVYVLSNNILRSFHFEQLFTVGIQEINYKQLELLKQQDFESLAPKYLAINNDRNIGCLISEVHKKYHVFFLESSS